MITITLPAAELIASVNTMNATVAKEKQRPILQHINFRYDAKDKAFRLLSTDSTALLRNGVPSYDIDFHGEDRKSFDFSVRADNLIQALGLVIPKKYWGYVILTLDDDMRTCSIANEMGQSFPIPLSQEIYPTLDGVMPTIADSEAVKVGFSAGVISMLAEALKKSKTECVTLTLRKDATMRPVLIHFHNERLGSLDFVAAPCRTM